MKRLRKMLAQSLQKIFFGRPIKRRWRFWNLYTLTVETPSMVLTIDGIIPSMGDDHQRWTMTSIVFIWLIKRKIIATAKKRDREKKRQSFWNLYNVAVEIPSMVLTIDGVTPSMGDDHQRWTMTSIAFIWLIKRKIIATAKKPWPRKKTSIVLELVQCTSWNTIDGFDHRWCHTFDGGWSSKMNNDQHCLYLVDKTIAMAKKTVTAEKNVNRFGTCTMYQLKYQNRWCHTIDGGWSSKMDNDQHCLYLVDKTQENRDGEKNVNAEKNVNRFGTCTMYQLKYHRWYGPTMVWTIDGMVHRWHPTINFNHPMTRDGWRKFWSPNHPQPSTDWNYIRRWDWEFDHCIVGDQQAVKLSESRKLLDGRLSTHDARRRS